MEPMNLLLVHRVALRSLALAYYGLLVVAAAKAVAQEAEPPLAAKGILKHMANRYATCRSYRDAGVLTSVNIDATETKTKETRFMTAFRRPDRFRFEYQDLEPLYGLYRYIVWAHGDDFRSYWDSTPPEQKHPSLELAQAGAVGVSEMTAALIPDILMPEQLPSRTLADLKDPRRIDDQKLGEHDCFRIQGDLAKWRTTVWIDKAAFLIRQVYCTHDFKTFRNEKTITYKPAVDVEIEDKELEFNPPTTRTVPSTAELLSGGAPPPTPWFKQVAWPVVAAATAIAAALIAFILVMIRRGRAR